MFAQLGAVCLLLLLQAALAPAQLITLRDGKVDVNFAGYHADAGLGGLLTGNAAHGGLSASAGTPWGSRAAAGIGGGLNGRTAGGAYAAAQANDDVGASALLGGSVGERGYIGSEAHVPGKVSIHSAQVSPQHVTSGPPAADDLPPVLPTAPSHIQKVKPPKKYSLIAQHLITLRDGKVGVNFAGYHADAGLGGLLTGNAAHGGLSASAGTPWGSRAAAGIGGGLNGRTAGGAYAAAQANDDVGASALLGGSVGERGYIGSEAHVPGKVSIHSAQVSPQHVTSGPPAADVLPPVLPTAPSHIQKVKPPKKYSLIAQHSDHSTTTQINENHVQTAAALPAAEVELNRQEPTPLIIVKRPRLRVKRPRQRQRTVYRTQVFVEEDQEQLQPQGEHQKSHSDESAKATPKSEAKVVQTRKYAKVASQRPQGVEGHVIAPQAQGVVGNALEIPIGILRSLQVSLGALTGGQPLPQ
ncbi:isoniazid-induced protein IniB isoform X1 [Drosophila virilis]|uniref:isoniazid-induced protein IniB isoform X1 n=1 Tax=Drosophila virilis TaxID=7244 RepID=UPI001395E956|nr:uncharacterized protein LOC6626899 isoform X1 [Drosophila virilis]